MKNDKFKNIRGFKPIINCKVDAKFDFKSDLKADDNSVTIMKEVCKTTCILGFFGLVGFGMYVKYGNVQT
jgi:hypothetical protein